MKYSVTLAISILLVYCDKGSIVTIEPLAEVNFRVGSSWQYVWTTEIRDSLGNLLASASDTVLVRVAANGEILGNDSGLTRFEAYSIPRYIGTQNVWYKSTSVQFVEIAYSRPGVVPITLPKRGGLLWMSAKRDDDVFFFTPKSVQMLLATGPYVDTILFRADKRVVYKYPLVIGSSWTSFQDPFLQTREVVNLELLNAINRVYNCAKIQTRLPTVSPNLEWFDYIAPEGLIARSIRIPKIPVSSPDDPENPKGWITVMERLNIIYQGNPN